MEIFSKHKLWLVLILVIYLLLRLLLLIKGPLQTFGYDYGLYLYALKNFHQFGWHNFIGSWEGYQHPLLFLFTILHLPLEGILVVSYVIICALIALSCYWFFTKQNTAAGLWAALLCVISISQVELFTLFLWKNALGVVLLLLSLKFLQEKQYKLLALSSLALILTHRTTTIIYAIVLALYVLYVLLQGRHWKTLAVLCTVALAGLYVSSSHLTQLANNFLHTNNPNVFQGIFLFGHNFYNLIWPIAITGLMGLWLYLKKQRQVLLPLMFLVSLVWVVAQLPFYNRIALYLDLSLILLSGYLFSYIAAKHWGKIVITIFLCISLTQALWFTTHKTPLITQAEIQQIQNFNFEKDHTQAFVVAASANDAPWLLGYLHSGIRLGAPGLFEDNHSLEQWTEFWNGQNQASFADSFPKPLFFYERSNKIIGSIEPCLQQYSNNFYLYYCK